MFQCGFPKILLLQMKVNVYLVLLVGISWYVMMNYIVPTICVLVMLFVIYITTYILQIVFVYG